MKSPVVLATTLLLVAQAVSALTSTRRLRGVGEVAVAPVTKEVEVDSSGSTVVVAQEGELLSEDEGEEEMKSHRVTKIAIPVPVGVPQFIAVPVSDSNPVAAVGTTTTVTNGATVATGANGIPGGAGGPTPAPTDLGGEPTSSPTGLSATPVVTPAVTPAASVPGIVTAASPAPAGPIGQLNSEVPLTAGVAGSQQQPVALGMSTSLSGLGGASLGGIGGQMTGASRPATFGGNSGFGVGMGGASAVTGNGAFVVGGGNQLGGFGGGQFGAQLGTGNINGNGFGGFGQSSMLGTQSGVNSLGGLGAQGISTAANGSLLPGARRRQRQRRR